MTLTLHLQDQLKRFLPLGLIIVSSFIAVVISLWSAEHIFFDKFMFMKSPKYGYYEVYPIVPEVTRNKHLQQRVNDLHLAYYPQDNKNNNSNVLGFSTETNDKQFTIAVIGDSIAYGQGIKTNETFARDLERRLNRISPTRVHLLALPGDSLVDYYAKFLIAEQNIKPDMYIFTLVDNDLVFDTFERYPNSLQAATILKQNCTQPDFIPKWRGDMTWQEQFTEVNQPSYSSEYSGICMLNNFAQLVPEDKSLFMSVTTSVESDYDYQLMQTYKNALKAADLAVLNIDDYPAFQYTGVSESEGHPSKETHRQYADFLYSEITSNSKWHFPILNSNE